MHSCSSSIVFGTEFELAISFIADDDDGPHSFATNVSLSFVSHFDRCGCDDTVDTASIEFDWLVSVVVVEVLVVAVVVVVVVVSFIDIIG